MKTLHTSIIMGLGIVLVILLSCSMTYTVSAFSHDSLDLEKISDSTVTQLEFNNSIITFEQHVNKTTYKIGETIYVYGQLRNVGTHDVYVRYPGPATSSVLKDQNGKFVDSFGGAYVLDGGPYGNETLHPNTTTTLRVWDFPRNVAGGGPWSLQIQPAELAVDDPGIYYVKSMINFNYRADTTSEHSKTITLWSKSLQITVLPEKYIQNETNSTISQNTIQIPNGSEVTPLQSHENGSNLTIHYETGVDVTGKVMPTGPPPQLDNASTLSEMIVIGVIIGSAVIGIFVFIRIKKK